MQSTSSEGVRSDSRSTLDHRSYRALPDPSISRRGPHTWTACTITLTLQHRHQIVKVIVLLKSYQGENTQLWPQRK